MASFNAVRYTAPENYNVSRTAPERSEGLDTAPERPEDSLSTPEDSLSTPEDSLSTPASSDQIYDHICEPCRTDGVDKEAKRYCQDCKQKICDACKDYHRKLAVTRNHVIVSLNKRLATVSGKQGPYHAPFNNAVTETTSREKTILLGRKVQSISSINVKVDDDKRTPWISGCAVMTSGDVVLCDRYNNKIKLLNRSGVLTGNVSLSSRPWDVSVLDSTSVIITLPDQKKLQVVQIYPEMKPGKITQLDKMCWGVEAVKEEMYITCHNNDQGEIRVLGLDGKVKRRLGVHEHGSFMFNHPCYIAINQSGDKIFVSDYKTDTVTCMSVDGRVIYTYKHNSLRRPRGLIRDSKDNILVCGGHSDNVQVLTADGRRHCTLLTASDGIGNHWSIAYRDRDNTLLVGCDEMNKLLSFQLAKIQ